MKAVKMDMDVVNCVLLIVILALVIYCCVKQGESFSAYTTSDSNKVMIGAKPLWNSPSLIHKYKDKAGNNGDWSKR